ncbi:hypothetical protein GCM10025865_09250 [Paraoerskovia sediminicola]|uniref:HNH endonuclease n=1 Tax=Paraoerskovia sediminicola TaxID=1138587 RepID=A0ABM8G0Y3_9CELL|nr:hypothetical protein GCM10025865_09250 [Paraoerskovia sediminicola]
MTPRRPGPITYKGAHRRVGRRRGRARDHGCVDCGGPARHWCYTHDDPAELEDGRGYEYSPDPQRYEPRCVSCHKHVDLARLEGRVLTAPSPAPLQPMLWIEWPTV